MAHTEPTEPRVDVETGSLTGAHWAGVGLAAVSGVVHLYLYWAAGFVLFLLAGLSFFGAIALVLLDYRRRLVYLAGVPFVLVQIVMWLFVGMPNFWLGVFDKAVQVALVGLLVHLYRREPSEQSRPEAEVTV